MRVLALLWGLAAALPAVAGADEAPRPCRVDGVEARALCGRVARPLDPSRPDGPRIDVHYLVLPALSRSRRPDPVFFFAGGPGQSASALAGPVGRLLARLGNRRDLVFVDLRGTGRSAPLGCDPPDPLRPLAEAADLARSIARLRDCGRALQRLPHGDLRFYATSVAVQDVEAVRLALGAPRIDAIGGSYGSRAVLEYLRQFPQAVRRAVIDGVAPPDMVLPASFSADAQAALDGLFAACAAEPGCAARHPALPERWRALLAGLPRETALVHPLTRRSERVTVTRAWLLSLVRATLYSPLLASALPLAIAEAAEGDFTALVGLGSAGSSGRRALLPAEGLHFSVVCSEDLPRLPQAADRPGADFGAEAAELYRQVCEGWPRGAVPEDFYRVGRSAVPVLVLSGGADPVTPPRHGERVARALGERARHVVVPGAGHGVMSLPCMRDVLFRFVDAADDAAALAVPADCAVALPRPPAYRPVEVRP